MDIFSFFALKKSLHEYSFWFNNSEESHIFLARVNTLRKKVH